MTTLRSHTLSHRRARAFVAIAATDAAQTPSDFDAYRGLARGRKAWAQRSDRAPRFLRRSRESADALRDRFDGSSSPIERREREFAIDAVTLTCRSGDTLRRRDHRNPARTPRRPSIDGHRP